MFQGTSYYPSFPIHCAILTPMKRLEINVDIHKRTSVCWYYFFKLVFEDTSSKTCERNRSYKHGHYVTTWIRVVKVWLLNEVKLLRFTTLYFYDKPSHLVHLIFFSVHRHRCNHYDYSNHPHQNVQEHYNHNSNLFWSFISSMIYQFLSSASGFLFFFYRNFLFSSFLHFIPLH
jgi:hypothetical protein